MKVHITYTVVSHRTSPLYIHHIPIGLLETSKENREVIRDSMGRHVRGFFLFFMFFLESWIMNIKL